MLRRLRERLRQPVSRQKGVALILVTATVAILGAVVADFSYNARVDLEAAANARDVLRAEYLARSGINLARLLIKVQQSVLDKKEIRQFIGDVQIGDFAPYLMKAFGGAADEREGLGALLGVDTRSMKGLGVGKSATFDVAMTSDDGRLNVNCGGGINPGPAQPSLYAILSMLMLPPRYNKIFETADHDGQFWTRDDVTAAIIDWTDVDESRVAMPGSPTSGGSEDYRYDTGRDPYKARNMYYDTIEELNLVKGVSDRFWGSFGDMLTVYGGCQINIGAVRPDNWPLVAAIIRATAKDTEKTNPTLLDDVLLSGLAQQVMSMGQLMSGFGSVKQFIDLVTDPAAAIGSMMGGMGGAAAGALGSLKGLPLDAAKLGQVITVGPRRIYRLDASGTIQRTNEKKIEVHIRAIWDSFHFNQNTTSSDMNDRQGTWVYWRLD